MKQHLRVVIAIFLMTVAFPVSLHQLSLWRLRDMTLSAIQHAAQATVTVLAQHTASLETISPSDQAFHDLPVTAVQIVPLAITAVQQQRLYGDHYQITVPITKTQALSITADLRRVLWPLALGAGGMLRLLLLATLSTVVMLWLRRRHVIPPASHAVEKNNSTAVTPDQLLLPQLIYHLKDPTLCFDHHQQLQCWNRAAQQRCAPLQLSVGIHLLDLSAHVSWGVALIEAVDAVALAPAADEQSSSPVRACQGQWGPHHRGTVVLLGEFI